LDNIIQGFDHYKVAISPATQFDLVGQIDAEGRWEPDYGRLFTR